MLYEVKCSTEEKPIYQHDVAYQVYVLTKLGFTVERACLVHLHNQYVRHGELDLQQLFSIVDLTEKARSMQPDVEHNLEVFATYLSRPDEPLDDLNRGCFKPYRAAFGNTAPVICRNRTSLICMARKKRPCSSVIIRA